MLSFVAPWALGLFALAGLVALFYFLRMRFRRQPVSSTFLWEKLVQSNEGGARLRWRSILLLILQLAVVTALVLALAGLQAVSTVPVKPGTLYLLDTSASMAAREPGQEGTRFDRARQALIADAKVQGGPVAVFAAGKVLRAEGVPIEALLTPLAPGTGEFVEGRAAEVLEAWIQTAGGTWSGVLVSDGGLDQGGTRLSGLFSGAWRTLDFAAPAPNVGITDLRITGAPVQVRATVFNGFDAPRPATLVLTNNGSPVERRQETLAPGIQVVTWNLLGPSAPGLWKMSLEGNTDALAADDALVVSLQVPRKARVLRLGAPDPFVKAAFAGTDYVERQGTSIEGGPWDLVVVTDTWPEGWKGNTVTFGALPPGAPVFWGQVVSGRMAGQASAHPLGRWVPWDDVGLAEGRGLVAQPGVTVLAEAGGWPVAATWEQEGSRFLALGFDTARSNVGLTPVLPVLLRNFRQAAVPQENNPLASNLRVGRTSLWAGSENWRVEGELGAVRRGGLWELTPQAAGTYRWTDGTESRVLSVQLPPAESDTSPRAVVPRDSRQQTVPAGTRLQAVPLAAAAALAALGLLVLEWLVWNGRLGLRYSRSLGALRFAAAAALLLALAGLSLPWPTIGRNLVLLFDASESLGPGLVEQERKAALSLIGQLAPADRVALIRFGGRPQIVAGLQGRDAARQTLEGVSLALETGAGSTDLGAALAAGAQLLEGQPGSSSQVVFTDGRVNAGGDLGSLSAAARRFPVSAVPLGRPLGGVAGQGLEVPSSVRPGEKASVRWQAWTDQGRKVTLELRVDSQVVETRPLALVPGTNSAEFFVDAGAPGTRKIEVGVKDAAGQALPSAEASGLLSVEGRASILVVRGPQTGNGIAAALGRQGLPVVTAGLPEGPEGYQGVSAVVIDNVPAADLTEIQQSHLRDWVTGGGGLLVVGGTHSLGRGEYFDSLLEDLLPVQTDNRQRLQFTRSRILFVVDHSGSMSEEVGQTTKLQAAVGGIAQSLDALTVQDEVGLLQFDSLANWVLPFTPLAQKDKVIEALGQFSQGGGTDLTKALDEVTAAFGHPGPVKRHVILMTDGQTGGEDQFFENFTETMKAAQVSMTVLGIGNEVNDELLKRLAEGSDGVYYRAVGDDIPTILHKETVRVTRDQIQEGVFPPLGTGQDPVVDVGTEPPPVLGYLVTQAKPLARVRWEVARPNGERDPLYADWRFGAGRVAVFASDSGQRWLKPWSARPEYNRFWGQAVRSLENSSRDKTLGLEVTVNASVAKVVVEALDSTGRLRTGASLAAFHNGRTTTLEETAPGRYEAALPLGEAGLQQITVADRTGPGRTWAWAWNPPGAELATGGTDWAGLGRLTAGTGGELQPLASPSPPAARWTWALVPLRDVLFLLSLVLFLIELGWRSMSLGQFDAARTQFAAWWSDQARPWTKRPLTAAVRDEAEVDRRTREAYKFLASRKTRGS